MVLLLKNVLFTLIAPGTFAVVVPLVLAGDASPVRGELLAVAWALFAAGASIYAWCVWDFALFGRGTPAPIDAPQKLVVRGLYRLIRNPMYVGVLTVIIGWAVLFQSARIVLYAAVAASVFHAFVLLYEEPRLEREFGDEYESYKSRAGRWLPRIPRRPSA